jgi:hypothetical protein
MNTFRWQGVLLIYLKNGGTESNNRASKVYLYICVIHNVVLVQNCIKFIPSNATR